MMRLAFFGVPLLFLAGSLQAQQVPNGALGASSSDTTAGNPTGQKMTPRQQAEMAAEIMMARKEFDSAAKAYQTILIDDPHNAKVLNLAGIAYQQLGDADRAEHYYKLAARADKTDSNALNNIGTVEFGQKRYGKAIKYYKQSISRGNAMATVHANLGYAYCSIKEYPKAMDSFAKALALDPEVFDHKGGSGTVLQQRSSPDPGSLHFTLAKSYGKIGDAERAARYLKMARDEGFKDFRLAEKDADFAKVIKDPRIQAVLLAQPGFAVQPQKPVTN